MVTIPRPPHVKDTPQRERARANLAKVIWNEDGTRRLPTQNALINAMQACHPDDVWWVCESSSAGPGKYMDL